MCCLDGSDIPDGRKRENHEKSREAGPILVFALTGVLAVLVGAFWIILIPRFLQNTSVPMLGLAIGAVHHLWWTYYLILSWFLATRTPPGTAREPIIPLVPLTSPSSHPNEEGASEGEALGDSSFEPEEETPTLRSLLPIAKSECVKCTPPIRRPPRAHHCGVCRQCVLRLDHHCPYLNQCIGAGNFKYFVRLHIALCYCCAWCMLTAGIAATSLDPYVSEDEWRELVRLLTIATACLIVTCVCGALLAWSLFLSWGGITHVELAILISDSNDIPIPECLGPIASSSASQTRDSSQTPARASDGLSADAQAGTRKREQRLRALRLIRGIRPEHGWKNARSMLGVDAEGGWVRWFVSRGAAVRGAAAGASQALAARKGA